MDSGEADGVRPPHYGDAELRPAVNNDTSELGARASVAMGLAREWLLARQHADGHWCGELEGDTILESEYILLLAWLGQEDSPLARKCAAYLVERQLPSGGWAMFPGGQIDISGSVKAYFALKLTGHDPQADYMRLARQAIHTAGGADVVNSFTRFYLALLGQISYDHCPAVPPELVLLPKWSPINIYRMSAWSRTIVVPLSIMWAHRPRRQIAPEHGIQELFLCDPEDWPPLRCPGLTQEQGWFSWDDFFRRADVALKWLEARHWFAGLGLRQRALAAAQRWMTTRFAHSDGLGAIFPPIIWSIIALKCLGYGDDSVELRYNFDQLRALTIEQQHTARLQPCHSPVWDTALALRALAVSGESSDDPAATRAVDWLLDKEVTRPGDWATYVSAPPAGWFFEYHNDFYPDVDDTAMVMIALGEGSGFRVQRSAQSEESQVRRQRRGVVAACERARRWLLAMQNRDGGWGAFDRDNDVDFLCRVPFADHNAMIDPSTPDLAGRALEALALWDQKPDHAAMQRGVSFLRRTQERDGAWQGRWGVNYIYGTWQALVGLAAAGVSTHDPAMKRGANWLLSHQHACGGWGESADSYEQPELRGRGPVTASQTAWALLGLMAAGLTSHKAVERGIYYLLDMQREDGGWDELEFTGTGFPRVFYLRYHYYPIYFPLLALSQYQLGMRVQGSGFRVQESETVLPTMLNPEP